MSGITIVLSSARPVGSRGRAYELVTAQFKKYRAPSHRFMTVIDDTDGAVDGPDHGGADGDVRSRWSPIGPRIERIPGDPAGRCLLPTFTCPIAGRERDLDHWYTTFHVPQVVAVAGFAAGRRFSRQGPPGPYPHEHERLALYELEGQDLAATLDRLQEALGTMEPTDSLDGASISSWCFQPL